MCSDPLTGFPLRHARMHEACGPAAPAFAAICAAQAGGDLLWVHDTRRPGGLNPLGLGAFFDPSRLLVAEVDDQAEALAVAEEALRDGSLPLVVVELGQPLGLTPGRRLQLAAKAGQATGICLIAAERMGSNAAETRWRCDPVFDPGFDPGAAGGDSTLQRWELIKNKSGTLGAWHVRWDGTAHRLSVVSPAGKRPGSAGAPG